MKVYHKLELRLLPGRLAVWRLGPGSAPPAPASGPFFSLTVTPRETSVTGPEEDCPEGADAERGFRALEVAGPLDFALTGVLASLAAPLAKIGVSVFALSTFETDYLLVRQDDLSAAVRALGLSGHRIHGFPE